ncbi:MAG: hypothetical protein ACTSWA_08225 [Candidatus Thorarchaeota archaeon]
MGEMETKKRRILDFSNPLFIILVLGLLVIIGAVLRIYHLYRTPMIPNDALDLMRAAQWMLGRESIEVYSLVPREPGWAIILAIVFIPFPLDYTSLFEIARITSSLLSVIIIPLTYIAAKKIAQEFEAAENKEIQIGLLSALFVTFNPLLISSAIMGLREPLQAILFLLWIIIYQSKGISKEFMIYGGICVFFSVLVRLDTFLLFAFLTIVILYMEWSSDNQLDMRFQNLIMILSPAIFAIAAYIAWMIACAILFGDPFITSSTFVEGYYRQEFGAGEIPADLSLFTYLFKYHSISDLGIAFVRGSSMLIKNYLGHFDILLGSVLLISLGHFAYKGKFLLPAIFSYSVLFYSVFAHLWGYVGYWRLLTPYFAISLIMVTIVLVKDLPDFEFKTSQGSRTIPSGVILTLLSLIILAIWISSFFLFV